VIPRTLAACQKDIKRRVRNLQKRPNSTDFALRLNANVKKVPNGLFQGLDPGEITFFLRLHARSGNECLSVWLLRQFETRMPL